MPAARHSAVTSDHFTDFGALLKYLRHRAGLTQRELAVAVGYSTSQISRLEHGERPPDATLLAARFVVALELANEPALADRLLELAANARAGAVPGGPAARHNLPEQWTSFVGREDALAEGDRLLRAARLVTLTGPGGSGKTRLALQLAARALAHFPDGVWLIELAPLADPVLVAQAIAAVLGVQEQPGRPILDSLKAYLGVRAALLVLDNCEHLITACAQTAESLLGACPKLRLLATSREALDLAGESILAVTPLSIPQARPGISVPALARNEAVRLFVDRAAAALPGFALNAANAGAVAAVCRELDGMPLAIEMAAVRVRLLRVEQIAERLGDRFQLLTGGRRTALRRHRSLAAVMDWSYELLSEPERAMLRRLAVFAGGWTLEAAEQVCGDDLGGISSVPVLDLLTGLVNKSLAVAERQTGREARYHLLETIRQYALAKLASGGDEAATRRRHAQYFRALAETAERMLLTRDQPLWLNRLHVELDNLRAVVAWSQTPGGDAEDGLQLASTLRDYWQSHGPLSEGLAWLEAGLETDRGVSPVVRARAFVCAGWLAVAAGEYGRSERHHAAGLAISQVIQDRLGGAWALCGLGYAAWCRGRYDQAQSWLEVSRATFQGTDDVFGLGTAIFYLAETARARGDYPAAHVYYDECRTVIAPLGPPRVLARLAMDLGHLARAEGQDDQAVAFYEEALTGRGEVGDKGKDAECLIYLARLALKKNNAAQARPLLVEALTVLRDYGTHNNLRPYYLGELGGLALAQGQARVAAVLLGATQAALDAIGRRLTVYDQEAFDRYIARARQQLDEATFNAAWAEGCDLTSEQAVALALNA